MKGDRFKLQQVLNYRSEMEKLRKQEFASAKQAFEHASDRLQQEERKMEELSQEFSSRQEELKTIDELRMYADFFKRKRRDIEAHKQNVEQLGQEMTNRREHLLDATKDKKVLESLKEKKTKEFVQQVEQKEQAFQDEITVQKKGDKS